MSPYQLLNLWELINVLFETLTLLQPKISMLICILSLNLFSLISAFVTFTSSIPPYILFFQQLFPIILTSTESSHPIPPNSLLVQLLFLIITRLQPLTKTPDVGLHAWLPHH